MFTRYLLGSGKKGGLLDLDVDSGQAHFMISKVTKEWAWPQHAAVLMTSPLECGCSILRTLQD